MMTAIVTAKAVSLMSLMRASTGVANHGDALDILCFYSEPREQPEYGVTIPYIFGSKTALPRTDRDRALQGSAGLSRCQT